MAENELSAEDKRTLAELAEWWRESGMTRRAALAGAVGGAGLAAGFGAGQAAAAPTGDEGAVGESGNRVEVWGSEIDATEVTASEADVTNETFVRASRSSESSSTTSGTFVNAYDGESKDVRGEFNASQQFSPDESGEYDIIANVEFTGTSVSDGDGVRCRIRNVTDGGDVVVGEARLNAFIGLINWAFTVNLNSAKAYEIQITDDDNDFKAGSGDNARGVIRRSVVA